MFDPNTNCCVLDEQYFLSKDTYHKLYKHQKEGVKWLWGLFKHQRGGILADDMVGAFTLQSHFGLIVYLYVFVSVHMCACACFFLSFFLSFFLLIELELCLLCPLLPPACSSALPCCCSSPAESVFFKHATAHNHVSLFLLSFETGPWKDRASVVLPGRPICFRAHLLRPHCHASLCGSNMEEGAQFLGPHSQCSGEETEGGFDVGAHRGS